MTFLCVSNLLTAQIIYSLGNESPYIERIQEESDHAVNDSIRAYGYLRLSLLYRQTGDVEKSKQYLAKGKELSVKYPFVQAAATYYEAIVEYAYRDIIMLEKGLLKTDSSLNLYDNAEANKLLSILWNNYGIVQQIKADEKGAMAAFTNKAVYYARKSGDAFVLAKAYKAIAIIFMNLNQREKASAYLKKAMEATEGHRDVNPVHLAELTDTYITAGENYAQQDQTDAAQIVLKKAFNILSPFPKSNLFLIYYNAEGVCFIKLQRYNDALISLNKGIMLAAELGAVQLMNRLKYSKYVTLSKTGRHTEGADVLKELINSATFTTDKKKCYKELLSTYIKLGKTNEALHWASEYIQLSDSLYEAKFQNDIIELEKKYKEAENQKKITELQAQHAQASLESRNRKLLNWLLTVIILFLSGSAFMIIVPIPQQQTVDPATKEILSAGT